MSEITTQPWFWPAVIVSVGLPLVLIGLTEFANMLQRTGSRAAPIVLMVRNYLVPVAGVLVLLSQPGAWEGSGTWPKVIWTIFGLLVIVVTINAVNHLVFHRAEKGSWRDRFPTIFSDLIRSILQDRIRPETTASFPVAGALYIILTLAWLLTLRMQPVTIRSSASVAPPEISFCRKRPCNLRLD